jgi:hypothetical protein
MTGTNFSSWYNNSEGTLYSDFSFVNTTESLGVVTLDNTTNSASYFMTLYRQGATWRYRTSLASLNITSTVNGSFNKVAFGYSSSNYPISVNGTTVQSNSGVGLVTSIDRLQIGNVDSIFFAKLNGTIKKIAYYPIRVTNTQLQALTGS